MSPDLPVTTDRNGHVIEVGSKVRGFLWPSMPDRNDTDFVEGVVVGAVEGVHSLCYKIRVTRWMEGGQVVRDHYHLWTAPVNGDPESLSGRLLGVQVVEAPQPPTIDDALSAAYDALQAIVSDTSNPEALLQAHAALNTIDSYRDDLDAHLEAVCEAREGVDLIGCREWDNAANVE